MTNMEEREKAFEKKYALDQETLFKIEARACRLFGLWAAERLSLTGDAATAFAGEVVAANLEETGFEDVKKFVRPHFADKSIAVNENEIDDKLLSFMEEARRQLMS